MRHEYKFGAVREPCDRDTPSPRGTPKGVCARNVRAVKLAPSRSLHHPQITRHTMPSNCRRNSLITNSWVPNYSTHFFTTGLPGRRRTGLPRPRERGPQCPRQVEPGRSSEPGISDRSRLVGRGFNPAANSAFALLIGLFEDLVAIPGIEPGFEP